MRIQKLTKALIIIHCLLFLIACSEYSDPVQTYSVDIQQRDSVSCFFTSYSYIPLETNENCMLGEVVGMKVNEDAIAIEDQGRILLFQHDGKFISKIDKAGRGAGHRPAGAFPGRKPEAAAFRFVLPESGQAAAGAEGIPPLDHAPDPAGRPAADARVLHR